MRYGSLPINGNIHLVEDVERIYKEKVDRERWHGDSPRRDNRLYPDPARALRRGQSRVGDLRGVGDSDHFGAPSGGAEG